jgi:hypothetical protein
VLTGSQCSRTHTPQHRNSVRPTAHPAGDPLGEQRACKQRQTASSERELRWLLIVSRGVSTRYRLGAAPSQPIRMRMLEPSSTKVPQRRAPSTPPSAIKRTGTTVAAGLFAGRKHSVPPRAAPGQPLRMRMLVPDSTRVPQRQATSAATSAIKRSELR